MVPFIALVFRISLDHRQASAWIVYPPSPSRPSPFIRLNPKWTTDVPFSQALVCSSESSPCSQCFPGTPLVCSQCHGRDHFQVPEPPKEDADEATFVTSGLVFQWKLLITDLLSTVLSSFLIPINIHLLRYFKKKNGFREWKFIIRNWIIFLYMWWKEHTHTRAH